MEIVQISCNKCGHPMPKLRLTKYGYDFCVECSTVSTKRGVPVMKARVIILGLKQLLWKKNNIKVISTPKVILKLRLELKILSYA